ncbi:MAG: hypothetical protein AAFP79_04985 [Pseudomonadota bacterium]
MKGLKATPAGERNRKLVFFDQEPTETARGSMEHRKGNQIAAAMGVVSYGTGSERRQAGVESAKTAATARIPANSSTRSITSDHLCELDGATWDVTGSVPYGRRELDITLVRQG